MPPTNGIRSATASTLGALPPSCSTSPRTRCGTGRRSRPRYWKSWAKRRCGMSLESDLGLLDPTNLTRGRFTYFPVVPGRVEFAAEVRQAILRDRPEVIALELPVTLEPAWVRAVRRLPEISVMVY